MAEEIRKRAACDRCHAQKIRCPRQSGQDVCDRCLKANATCVFSPFRQKKAPDEPLAEPNSGPSVGIGRGNTLDGRERVKRKRFTPSPQFQEINLEGSILPDCSDTPLDFGVDWMSHSFSVPEQSLLDGHDFGNEDQAMSFAFNQIDSSPVDCYSQSGSACNNPEHQKVTNLSHSIRTTPSLLLDADDDSSPAMSIDSNLSSYVWGMKPQSIDSESASSYVRKLSELSVELYEHYKTVPPQSIHDPLSIENQAKWSSLQCPPDFTMEDTLRLTQTMIEMYPPFLSFLSTQRIDSSHTSINTSTSLPLIDHSAILLMISCHLRLITIFEELFKHMGVCLSQKGKTKTLQQALMNAPQLKIGTYAPPPSSVIPITMMLYMQFATQLSDYATDLAAQIQDQEPGPSTPTSGSGSSTNSSHESLRDTTLTLTIAAAENVKARASWMMQQLNELRNQMLIAGLPA